MKKLGSGAFGEIFKVEKKKTGEHYAAKIVSFSLHLIYSCRLSLKFIGVVIGSPK